MLCAGDDVPESLMRLSQRLTAVPEIAEFDINPFFTGVSAEASAAADARIALT